MNTAILAQRSKPVARKHFDVGYALYAANQPVSACQNDDQRRGWHNAQRGHMACMAVDAVFAAGGNGRDADNTLAGGW